ncbi:MAG: ABC transporter ATP-binding protein [Deltaproteobacteria bacterium]|jgi:putative ABC transport system ATP-binding protein|nr:ABC transporter ATP-binding protein [Deltaproteobacteria bacterium]
MPTDKPLLVFKKVIKKRPGGAGYSLLVSKLEVRPGDRIALVGQSGSGKSTLLDMLGLASSPYSVALSQKGEFTFYRPAENKTYDIWESWVNGRSSAREKIRSSDLGYVLQAGGLLPFLNVRDNIILPATIKKYPKGAALEKALFGLAEILGIGRLLKKFPGSISMGERQRVAVARAVIHKPQIILADEPTASLDPPTAAKVFELLLELSDRAALVVATHDEPKARSLKFRIFRVVCEDRGPNAPIKATLRVA